jgi:hypothetical protein
MAGDLVDLPELPAELEGAMSDLGRFRAEYRAGLGLVLYMLLGLLLLAMGGGMTLLLTALVFEDHFHVGFAKLFVLSIALTIGGGFMCFRSIRAWGTRVLLFERCLVYLKGNKMRVFGWAEIASLTKQTPTGMWGKMTQSSYLMTIRRADGAVLTIDAYVDRAKELGDRVEVEWARSKQLPAAEPAEGRREQK